MRIPQASEFFICGLKGSSPSLSELRFIKQNRLGGLILFKRNIESIEQITHLNKTIIEANNEFPPIISVDQEGGRVARLRGICTDLPPISELEPLFLQNENLAYRVGAMQARELVSLGFNLNFAPVCDVVTNLDNLVIGDRAFSKNPQIAAALSSKYIKGLQGAGVAACAKHFPGHGATSIDSHLALPVIRAELADIIESELIPFKAAISADVATIMTAHIITKCLDDYPATLSFKTLNGLLRQTLAFDKLLISDDLDMKAMADNFSLSQIIELAFRASVDLFIIGNNFDKVQEAIAILQKLIDSDDQIRGLAVKSASRIEAFRLRFIGKPLAPDLASAKEIVRCKPHLDMLV